MGETCGTHGRKGELTFGTKAEGTRPRDGVEWMTGSGRGTTRRLFVKWELTVGS
jgi:hypothetical protein